MGMFPCQALFSKNVCYTSYKNTFHFGGKMTSIIDVAKVAGVSKSTVSRLISGKGYVSADSQEKNSQSNERIKLYPELCGAEFTSRCHKTIGF